MTDTSESIGAQSVEARKESNGYFMNRQFPQGKYSNSCLSTVALTILALGSYHKAADPDPADYRPVWNISAVHYELGDYDLSSEYAKRALDIVPKNEAVAAQKILHRLAKAHLALEAVRRGSGIHGSDNSRT